MAIDKSKNTQILVTFPNDILEKIEDYRFSNRIGNRTKAILELIEKGLEKEQSD